MKSFALKPKSSGILYVEYYEGEVRRRITTGSRDTKVARQRAREIVSGNVVTPTPSAPSKSSGMTMGQLLDLCCKTVWAPRNVRSQRTVKSNAKILREMIGDEPVSDMTFTRLELLVQELFNRGYAAGTVHRKMCAVSKALNYAAKITGPNGKPVFHGKPSMPTVVTKNSRSRVITAAEEKAIFSAIEKRANSEPARSWTRFAHLIRFLLDTGCRLGEALNLSDALIESDGDATFVTFPRYSTKNDEPRKLPLSKAIVASLPYLRSCAVGEKLFPMKSQTVWYMWNSIRSDLVAAGLPVADVVLHTMRHTCLTRLARSGLVPLERISDWAGHSTIQVTMDHYRHMLPADKLSTLAVIEDIAAANANQ